MQADRSYIQVRAMIFQKYLGREIKFCTFVKTTNAVFKHRKQNPNASPDILWATANKLCA